MKTYQPQNNNKSKKTVLGKENTIKPRKNPNLFKSTQLKSRKLENYKTFFRYLISGNPNIELADEQ